MKNGASDDLSGPKLKYFTVLIAHIIMLPLEVQPQDPVAKYPV